MNKNKYLTYNKNGVIITSASKIVWRHDVARDMREHISFFLFKKKKQSGNSAYKDYSLFLSWFSLLLLLSNNKTINLQIKSNEDTFVAPPFCKGFAPILELVLVYIILNNLSSYCLFFLTIFIIIYCKF